jgi:hypothetical protein
MESHLIKPDWVRHIEMGLGGVQEGEKKCEEMTDPAYRGYAKASYTLAREKYEAEIKLYQKNLEAGYVIVDTIVHLPFQESAGLRLSKFFQTWARRKFCLPMSQHRSFSPKAGIWFWDHGR